MNDLEKIEMIRAAMPAVTHQVYLNTGTTGPLSQITVDALIAGDRLELEQGRADLRGFGLLRQAMNDTRQTFAQLTNATPADIALTHHTTEGINIVAHGLRWQPGDEIITTDQEHEGGLLPLYVLRQRHGVVIRMLELERSDLAVQFEAAITPRTRLFAFSHVTWSKGVRLPLKEIVTAGHKHGVLSLVDGAQSTGAIPLDLPASGVDFYAMPGQKWLCGPEGIGALYLRRDRLSLVDPTFVGFFSLEDPSHYDDLGYFMPARTARRYEVGTLYRPGIKAMAANLKWLEETVGWPWIYARIGRLAQYARDVLSRLPGVSILTPPGFQAGLLTFNLKGHDPAKVMAQLAAENIILRYIPHPYALRISTGFYNTEGDLDRLATVLRTILERGPAE
jgi:L-cysteine/cystine lyase